MYSVVRNLEWAFPATFVLGIIAVPLWSADVYAGMTLSLTAVALAFGLLRPRRVEKSLGKWRVWLVSLLAPLAVLQVVIGLAALWHGSLVGGRTRTLAFQAEIADADRVVIRKGGGGCHGDPDRDDVLYVITNKAELAEFGKMFRFSGSSMPCMCCGYPGIDWWRDGQRVVVSALHHGHALRVEGFGGDLQLTILSSRRIRKWLEENCGLTGDNGFPRYKYCRHERSFIESAAQNWATAGAERKPTLDDLRDEFKKSGKEFPKCPAGGEYSLIYGEDGTPMVKCTVPRHD